MAITNFIPEIWSSKLLLNFQRDAVFAGLVNREYEGEASKGNTVHIAGITDVAIKDYKAAGRTTTADAISDTGVAKRAVLLVSKEAHCLHDLLGRVATGELPARLDAVVGNHEGLGDIVRAHGGEIVLENSPMGGLRARVRLPMPETV